MEKQDLIKKAINELGIDVPVMATRMVGGRLELHLYGGAVVKYETGALPADEPPGPATAEQNLAKMKTRDRWRGEDEEDGFDISVGAGEGIGHR